MPAATRPDGPTSYFTPEDSGEPSEPIVDLELALIFRVDGQIRLRSLAIDLDR